jgi:hypothetical protein
MIRRYLPRFSFLLAGLALAALIANGFLWYGAAQAPHAPFLAAVHKQCGQPVALRAEDYDRWGSTRPGDDIELARLDFCDPVRLRRNDGRQEVWFWLEIEVTGQVFPYAGWGYPWQDVQTPFPADSREPRNPWWKPNSSLRGIPGGLNYTGGDGYPCPHSEAVARGVDLFFFREEGFQLPVGTHHSGWVCMYFDNGDSLPDAFIVSVQPDRARITQWVDRLYVVRNTGVSDQPAIPVVVEGAWCDFVRQARPASIHADGPCAAES